MLHNTPYGQAQKKVKEIEQQIVRLKQIQVQVESDEQHLNGFNAKEEMLEQRITRCCTSKKNGINCGKSGIISVSQRLGRRNWVDLVELQEKIANLQWKESRFSYRSFLSEEELDEYIKCIQKRDHLEQMLQENNQQVVQLPSTIG